MNVININCVVLWLLQINARLHAKKSAMRVVGGQIGNHEIHQYIVRMEIKVTGPRGYLVRIYHLCTATVITPVWVLTAAHCIEVLELEILSSSKKWKHSGVIRYGSVTPETNGTLSDILAAQKYPLFLYSEVINDVTRHDIGLMKTTPIHLDKYGKLSAVDYKTLYGQTAVAAGYGGVGGVAQHKNTLQVLDVLIKKCTAHYSLLPAICLSNRCRHSSSLCPGDSGGPLLHASGVVGVVALGDTGICSPNMLNARYHMDEFINPVSPYIDWIMNHMKQNGMT